MYVTPVSPMPAPVIDHRHYSFYAKRGNWVEVELDQQANVILLDDINYARYRNGVDFRYQGGYTRYSRVTLPILYSGNWHLVIDLGGLSGRLRATARLVRSGLW
jgi:hypothetical protein